MPLLKIRLTILAVLLAMTLTMLDIFTSLTAMAFVFSSICSTLASLLIKISSLFFKICSSLLVTCLIFLEKCFEWYWHCLKHHLSSFQTLKYIPYPIRAKVFYHSKWVFGWGSIPPYMYIGTISNLRIRRFEISWSKPRVYLR